MVTDEGAIYVTSNMGYNWKAAVEETVSATLNRCLVLKSKTLFFFSRNLLCLSHFFYCHCKWKCLMNLLSCKLFRYCRPGGLVLLLGNLALCMHLVRWVVYFLWIAMQGQFDLFLFAIFLFSCRFSNRSDNCFISTCNVAVSLSLQLILSLWPIHDLQFEISWNTCSMHMIRETTLTELGEMLEIYFSSSSTHRSLILWTVLNLVFERRILISCFAAQFQVELVGLAITLALSTQ